MTDDKYPPHLVANVVQASDSRQAVVLMFVAQEVPT